LLSWLQFSLHNNSFHFSLRPSIQEEIGKYRDRVVHIHLMCFECQVCVHIVYRAIWQRGLLGCNPYKFGNGFEDSGQTPFCSYVGLTDRLL
jgi:hypothetical protein